MFPCLLLGMLTLCTQPGYAIEGKLYRYYPGMVTEENDIITKAWFQARYACPTACAKDPLSHLTYRYSYRCYGGGGSPGCHEDSRYSEWGGKDPNYDDRCIVKCGFTSDYFWNGCFDKWAEHAAILCPPQSMSDKDILFACQRTTIEFKYETKTGSTIVHPMDSPSFPEGVVIDSSKAYLYDTPRAYSLILSQCPLYKAEDGWRINPDKFQWKENPRSFDYVVNWIGEPKGVKAPARLVQRDEVDEIIMFEIENQKPPELIYIEISTCLREKKEGDPNSGEPIKIISQGMAARRLRLDCKDPRPSIDAACTLVKCDNPKGDLRAFSVGDKRMYEITAQPSMPFFTKCRLVGGSIIDTGTSLVGISGFVVETISSTIQCPKQGEPAATGRLIQDSRINQEEKSKWDWSKITLDEMFNLNLLPSRYMLTAIATGILLLAGINPKMIAIAMAGILFMMKFEGARAEGVNENVISETEAMIPVIAAMITVCAKQVAVLLSIIQIRRAYTLERKIKFAAILIVAFAVEGIVGAAATLIIYYFTPERVINVIKGFWESSEREFEQATIETAPIIRQHTDGSLVQIQVQFEKDIQFAYKWDTGITEMEDTPKEEEIEHEIVEYRRPVMAVQVRRDSSNRATISTTGRKGAVREKKFMPHLRRNVKNMKGYILYPEEYDRMRKSLYKLDPITIGRIYAGTIRVHGRNPNELSSFWVNVPERYWDALQSDLDQPTGIWA